MGRFALKKCLFEAVYISNIACLGGKVKLWILVDGGAAMRTEGGLVSRWRMANIGGRWANMDGGRVGKMLLDRGEKV